MLTRRFIIKGRVQGVGFRYFAQRCAKLRGIAGYARNLWDGDVEVTAQGSPEMLTAFLSDLREGPRAARVTEVVEEELDLPTFDDFRIEFI